MNEVTKPIEATAEDYDKIIEERAQIVFDAMAPRESAENMRRLREAFEFAKQAHSAQKRKTGEPYILHPIAVATIVAKDLRLGADPVIAAFLHDVVEDTPCTISELSRIFGTDVAMLVKVLTKQKKDKYETSKQFDNFKQMLISMRYDIRALLIKLADRLHNMRTLSSMRADKQMKIAGETDYFFAPLANRLGLYNIKTELENLSMRFRCPHEFDEMVRLTELYKAKNGNRIESFRRGVAAALASAGLPADVVVTYRQPYSLRRMMEKTGEDFWHLSNPYTIDVTFPDPPVGTSEKKTALAYYSVLTDRYKEKPGSVVNYIDAPKENGYRSFHVKLLSDFGQWQDVHISSAKMREHAQLGVIAEHKQGDTNPWVEKLKKSLHDMALRGEEKNMVEQVVESLYNDDIMTFTPNGKPVVLPKNSTPIDFAFEIHTNLGYHARYARINGQLSSIKTKLKRGDVVEIFPNESCHPTPDWEGHIKSFKAKKALAAWKAKNINIDIERCHECKPLPGEDVIGYREDNGKLHIHKRDCPIAIRLASRFGDNICSVDYEPSDTLYNVTIQVRGIDRHGLMIDLLDSISNKLDLSMSKLETWREDAIVTSVITFGVHSFQELQTVINIISEIDGVDEVKEII
ncbi:MAG: bifunctional (p)ppGpp synthetase/guanosine-3',5'-bis(diphosphate) 3'-pyrophosphohydrolase [Bacteroidales bacterium]|nr:bifunctional (p)ppGpp synthetase/guanosine-3',5'-bis(diphosphate) 3'-pyrophosphohydrolase [Bacteroidales bacterium]